MEIECCATSTDWWIHLSGIGLGGLIGFFSAYWLMLIKRKKTASGEYRAAFSPTIAFIKIVRAHGTKDKPSIDEFVKRALFEQAKAIEEFRQFIPNKELSNYEKAWSKYMELVLGCPFEMAGDEYQFGAKEGELFESNLNALLKFSET